MGPAGVNRFSKEEINDVMQALGFHRINSRDRWKLKISSIVQVTDAEIRYANDTSQLSEHLSKILKDQLRIVERFRKKKLVLLALLKSGEDNK